MIDCLYEFADPRQIVVGSPSQIREKCRVLSKAGLKFGFLLTFPGEELSLGDRPRPELPDWWDLAPLYMRSFAWKDTEVRCCIQPGEVEKFWRHWSEHRGRNKELTQEIKVRVLNAVVEEGLWEKDEAGALWCYPLAKQYLALSWLIKDQITMVLVDVIDEQGAEPM